LEVTEAAADRISYLNTALHSFHQPPTKGRAAGMRKSTVAIAQPTWGRHVIAIVGWLYPMAIRCGKFA